MRKTAAPFHNEAADQHRHPSGLGAEDNYLVDFHGTHTGEFAGIQPTGRPVRVPYSVIYDLGDDLISALRIYFPMGLLIEQLTS